MSDDTMREDDFEDRPRRRGRDPEGRGEDERDRPRRRRQEEPKSGGGKTLLFVLLGVGAVLLLGCVGVVGVMFFAVGRVRDAAARQQSQNNLKQIGLAFHNHENTYNRLPEDIKGKDGKPLLSWRVAILPYVEQDNLYKQFKLDEPWDSPNNKRLLSQLPKVYRRPGEIDDPAQGLTHYQGFAGSGTVFDPQRKTPLRIQQVTDGTSNTLLVVEADDAVPWTKPGDITYDPKGAPPKLGGLNSGRGFNAVFLSGETRFIRLDQPGYDAKLRGAITYAGNETTLLE